MEGLFDKQAAMYLTARPGYPSKWFPKPAALRPHHYLAWDIDTGNARATIGNQKMDKWNNITKVYQRRGSSKIGAVDTGAVAVGS